MARKSALMTDAAVWKDARGHIHIAGTVNGHKVISTVTSNPRSKRAHANLYRKLNVALGCALQLNLPARRARILDTPVTRHSNQHRDVVSSV